VGEQGSGPRVRFTPGCLIPRSFWTRITTDRTITEAATTAILAVEAAILAPALVMARAMAPAPARAMALAPARAMALALARAMVLAPARVMALAMAPVMALAPALVMALAILREEAMLAPEMGPALEDRGLTVAVLLQFAATSQPTEHAGATENARVVETAARISRSSAVTRLAETETMAAAARADVSALFSSLQIFLNLICRSLLFFDS